MIVSALQRRELIALIGSTIAALPFSARAQKKLPTIGFLGSGTPAADSPWTVPFEQRLAELGWIHGRTVAIEDRWGDGSLERYDAIAAELVRLPVGVIITGGPIPVSSAQRAAPPVPLGFAAAGRP